MEAVQGILVAAAAFVVVLSIVVFVHEYGHFSAARSCKIAVDTFSIGFGKPIAAWTDKAGVRWKIGNLPLGGYVKFTDDADASSSGPTMEYASEEERLAARARGAFHAQPLRAKAFVIAAGPLTNFLFAIVAFAALVLITGRDVTPVSELSPRIDRIIAGEPADKAGLKPGDVIRTIDGAPIDSYGDLKDKVAARAGETLQVGVQRGGAQLELPVVAGSRVVTDQTGVETKIGYLGITRDTLSSERKIDRLNPLEALGFGVDQTWGIIKSTGLYLYNVVTGQASSKHIAGTLGILDQSGKIAEDAWSSGGGVGEKSANLALSLIGWSAVLSVAVGIVNLLPVPILDGGHLVFYAIEAVRGRPLSARAQEMGFRAGLVVIASLFLFATWNDLQRFKLLEFLGGMLS